MSQIITVASFKGGAGKSTTTASLAYGLAQKGHRVLVVDADSQGGVTAALGLTGPFRATLADVVANRSTMAAAAIPAHGFEVVPSEVDLAGAEIEVVGTRGWQSRIGQRLETITAKGETDFVLIDSAPGLGVLPFMALHAARLALIVTPLDFMSVRVLPQMLATCARARTEVLGILPTMVSGRTMHEREALDAIMASYPELILPGIPRRVALQEAAVAGQPIGLYSPRSDATKAYNTITEELLNYGN